MASFHNDSDSAHPSFKRREFVAALLMAAGASIAIPAISRTAGEPPQTVQQVIDLILKSIPDAPVNPTVDNIKAGDKNQTVTGIVTTMFATDSVIEKAAAAGANFIIAHEPTFYNHTDTTAWLEKDAVYQYKHDLLTKHSMVVWRFHDYWHAHRPDGILMGVLTALGWDEYYDAGNPHLITIPSKTLREVIATCKSKLKIQLVKAIGDPAQVCRRIALLPGASGGKTQIELLGKEKPDVLICGEINEWETSEYIRDARYMGQKSSLIVLGHAVSEEAGMQWLVPWLQAQLPGVKITHIPSNDPFMFV